MKLKASKRVDKKTDHNVHDVLCRVVTNAMMRRATDCPWIGTTPSFVMRHAQLDLPKGFRPRKNYYAEVREHLNAHQIESKTYTGNYVEQTVKWGASALRYLADINRAYVLEDLSGISHEMVFEFMRGCAARETDSGTAYRTRTALTMLARGNESRNMTVDVDHAFYSLFGFSPCNKKPRIAFKDWWLGDPTRAMRKLAEVDFPCSSKEFVVIALFANAFRLSLRAAICARISESGTEVRIEGKNAKGEQASLLLPVQAVYQRWAVKHIRAILDWTHGECALSFDNQTPSKMIFKIEEAMEAAQILPCDTDYILPAIPWPELRRAAEKYCEGMGLPVK